MRICDFCGKKIPDSRRAHAKRCSNKCSKALEYVRSAGFCAYLRKLSAKCKICGSPLGTTFGAGTLMCSESCRRVQFKMNARNRGYNWYIKNRLKIAKRDEWACYLCGESIPQDVFRPDPRSLTIDHILPMHPTEGCPAGDGEPVNLSATHQLCNGKKGNRVTSAALERLLFNLRTYGEEGDHERYENAINYYKVLNQIELKLL